MRSSFETYADYWDKFFGWLAAEIDTPAFKSGDKTGGIREMADCNCKGACKCKGKGKGK